MSWRVLEGDCVELMQAMPEASVDAVVCDPPYGLEFMGKEWDRLGGGQNRNGKPGIGDRPTGWVSNRGWNAMRCRNCGHLSHGGSPCRCDTPDFAAADNRMRDMQAWHEAWAREALRVLKPGGHLLAFGGTRTYHRLACAIEDAGFEIRDCLAWLYGSGFPKSLDVSKAIDKRPGVQRHGEFATELREAMAAKGYTNTFDVAEKVLGRRTGAVANWQKYQWPEAKWWPALRDLLDMDESWGDVIAETERERTGRNERPPGWFTSGDGHDITAPATSEAEQWDGWGTALKPAHEPIVMARKPLSGTVAGNVLAFGTGALNVDATRILSGQRPTLDEWESEQNLCDSCAEDAAETQRPTRPATKASTATNSVAPTTNAKGETPPSDTCKTDTGCSAGTSEAAQPNALTDASNSSTAESGKTPTDPSQPASSSTTSTGSRPTTGSRTCNSCGEAITTPITTKASNGRWPSNVVLDEQAAEMLDQQTGELHTHGNRPDTPVRKSGFWARADELGFDSRFTGDSGGASRFLYVAKASSAERNAGLDGFEEQPTAAMQGNLVDGQRLAGDGTPIATPRRQNVHPTVKPIELMRWLVRLVTPPGGLVLDPFTGSGTTGAACVLEGFRFVGCEREPEYVRIAEARIAWWSKHPDGLEIVKALEAESTRRKTRESGQLGLLEDS